VSKTIDENPTRTRRFQDATPPHLDYVYTLARYLLQDAADAEDAVQECYLRALRYFDTLRSPKVKPWLFAILRNVCRDEYERRARLLPYDVNADSDNAEGTIPFWQEPQATPEMEMLRKLDVETIRALVAALPESYREVIVLRELENLPYREIADVVDVPIGTVMSRLARGRAILREGWLRAGHEDEFK
jgi:RNA polymerase sigma-70 factor (ECF subfamily)